MAQIINLSATTELEAVNALLSAVGDQAVAEIDTARADVERAVNILRDKTRTLQNDRWKFNTEFGLGLDPSDSISWVQTYPTSALITLSVFRPPTGLSRWTLSSIREQAFFDATVRPSKEYVDPISSLPVPVFYDRTKNRDGFEPALLRGGKLWIDAVWYLDFEQLPDTARRYIVASAMLDFIVDTLGEDNRAVFKARSEQAGAWLALKDDQGDDDEYSLLDSPDVAGILGNRFRDRGRGFDNRSSP